MKLFSRKSLVAGATAIAVSFAGVNVATAEEPPKTPVVEKGEGEGDKDKNDNPGSSIGDLSSSEDKDVDPKEIQAWIGVVSAIIGVLGSLFAFFSKHFDIPGLK